MSRFASLGERAGGQSSNYQRTPRDDRPPRDERPREDRPPRDDRSRNDDRPRRNFDQPRGGDAFANFSRDNFGTNSSESTPASSGNDTYRFRSSGERTERPYENRSERRPTDRSESSSSSAVAASAPAPVFSRDMFGTGAASTAQTGNTFTRNKDGKTNKTGTSTPAAAPAATKSSEPLVDQDGFKIVRGTASNRGRFNGLQSSSVNAPLRAPKSNTVTASAGTYAALASDSDEDEEPQQPQPQQVKKTEEKQSVPEVTKPAPSQQQQQPEATPAPTAANRFAAIRTGPTAAVPTLAPVRFAGAGKLESVDTISSPAPVSANKKQQKDSKDFFPAIGGGPAVPAPVQQQQVQQSTGGISQLGATAAWGGVAAPVPVATTPAPAAQKQQTTTTTTTTTPVEKKQPATEKKAAAPQAKVASTPFQKSMAGEKVLIPLGQYKKSIGDIVPYPTDEQVITNIATSIAYTLEQGEYSIETLTSAFYKSFIDASVRYAKKNNLDIDTTTTTSTNDARELIFKALQITSKNSNSTVLKEEYPTFMLDKLELCVPLSISSIDDAAVKQDKIISYYKDHGLEGCLADILNKDNDSKNTATLQSQLCTIASDKGDIVSFLNKNKDEISKSLSSNTTEYISSIVQAIFDANLNMSTTLSIFNALWDTSILLWIHLQTWKSSAPASDAKRKVLISITSWLKDKEPKIEEPVYDYEEDEDYDI